MHLLLIEFYISNVGEFDMRASKSNFLTLWLLFLLVMPFVMIPNASAWEMGDEEAIFGHTFAEEYWTNDSLRVEGENGNGSLTTSYVNVGDFQAFLIAFNEFNHTDGHQIITPYQLFGMHYTTPDDKEVFIGAIFAFLLVTNDTHNPDDNLPDVGNEPSWYVVPIANNTMFPEYQSSVEPIPATKESENHYRFGMRYHNLTCRIVEANTAFGFWATLALPVLQVVISELTIQYDILIDEVTGEVHAETLYTIGQVKEARFLGFETDPSDLVVETMEISAVHFLSVFATNSTMVGSTSGHSIASPTDTTPMNENVTIQVGNGTRAFDIGFGREYDLINETTDTVVHSSLTALNTLLGVQLGDLLLILWQAPLSAFLFAHMSYGLSENMQSTFPTVGGMVANVSSTFTNTNWWYGVTFPTWNGLRVEQDPVYVAYTSLATTTTTTGTTTTTTTTTTTDTPEGGILGLILIVGVVAIIVVLIRRRS